MWFEVLALNYFFAFYGINHFVEILQNIIFFYIILACSVVLSLNWTSDLKRFFFFSEMAWLALFAVLLILASLSNTTQTYSHAFMVLVFTACEAVILACILLIVFESKRTEGSF